jgi:hypothetical protein
VKRRKRAGVGSPEVRRSQAAVHIPAAVRILVAHHRASPVRPDIPRAARPRPVEARMGKRPLAEHPLAEHPSAEHPSAAHPSAAHPSVEHRMEKERFHTALRAEKKPDQEARSLGLLVLAGDRHPAPWRQAMVDRSP